MPEDEAQKAQEAAEGARDENAAEGAESAEDAKGSADETSADEAGQAEESGEAGKAEEVNAPGDASGEEEPADGGAKPVEFEDFSTDGENGDSSGIEMLMDVDLDVKIELGRAEMTIEDILNLHKGSVVELDKLAGDPVDILVNERLVAKGEILVVNDNFCVRVTEIIDPEAGVKVEEEAVE